MKHYAKGMCTACYRRERNRRKRETTLGSDFSRVGSEAKS